MGCFDRSNFIRAMVPFTFEITMRKVTSCDKYLITIRYITKHPMGQEFTKSNLLELALSQGFQNILIIKDVLDLEDFNFLASSLFQSELDNRDANILHM